MLNTLRSVVNDDAKLVRAAARLLPALQVPEHHDRGVVAWFNQHTGMNLTPIFDQYLRHAAIPRLELLFGSPGR